ncbi:hypothetical protein [Fictibacillus sp. KU28468]|uniref:hypothetical protein n=1 Tax=Fictibacillus sp. KU28468 TaxID=2991053 RepID=UPI00223E166D|nr:hypothetical protein [Fictibacillus sp. KU28468]UZJ80133.1 hypothetical protein OKX00_06605 [Fictibacillus sp. KU28468]
MPIDLYIQGIKREVILRTNLPHYLQFFKHWGCTITGNQKQQRLDITRPSIDSPIKIQTLFQNNETPSSFHQKTMQLFQEQLISYGVTCPVEGSQKDSEVLILNISFQESNKFDRTNLTLYNYGPTGHILPKKWAISLCSPTLQVKAKKRWSFLSYPILEIHCIFPENYDPDCLKRQIDILALTLAVIHLDFYNSN